MTLSRNVCCRSAVNAQSGVRTPAGGIYTGQSIKINTTQSDMRCLCFQITAIYWSWQMSRRDRLDPVDFNESLTSYACYVTLGSHKLNDDDNDDDDDYDDDDGDGDDDEDDTVYDHNFRWGQNKKSPKNLGSLLMNGTAAFADRGFFDNPLYRRWMRTSRSFILMWENHTRTTRIEFCGMNNNIKEFELIRAAYIKATFYSVLPRIRNGVSGQVYECTLDLHCWKSESLVRKEIVLWSRGSIPFLLVLFFVRYRSGFLER